MCCYAIDTDVGRDWPVCALLLVRHCFHPQMQQCSSLNLMRSKVAGWQHSQAALPSTPPQATQRSHPTQLYHKPLSFIVPYVCFVHTSYITIETCTWHQNSLFTYICRYRAGWLVAHNEPIAGRLCCLSNAI